MSKTIERFDNKGRKVDTIKVLVKKVLYEKLVREDDKKYLEKKVEYDDGSISVLRLEIVFKRQYDKMLHERDEALDRIQELARENMTLKNRMNIIEEAINETF